jgi:hypothetical protein
MEARREPDKPWLVLVQKPCHKPERLMLGWLTTTVVVAEALPPGPVTVRV